MKHLLAYTMVSLGALFAACNSSNNNGSTNNNEEGGADAFAESGSSGGGPETGATSSGGGDATPDATMISDGQIVGIVISANTGEIEEADMALGVSLDGGTFGLDAGDAGDAAVDAYVALDAGTARYQRSSVGQFAQMMIADHTAANVAIQKLGIAANSSTLQAGLEVSTTATLAQLSGLTGSAFDRAYMQSQVTAHLAVRDLLTNQLIPNATDAKLKAALMTSVLPTVESHLASAQTLLAELTDGGLGDAASDAADAGAD